MHKVGNKRHSNGSAWDPVTYKYILNTSDSTLTVYISSLLLSANLLRRFRFNQLRYRDHSPIHASDAISHLEAARSNILKILQELSTEKFSEEQLRPFLVLLTQQVQDDLYRCQHALLTSLQLEQLSDEIRSLDWLTAAWKAPGFLYETSENRLNILEKHLKDCDDLGEMLKLKIASLN